MIERKKYLDQILPFLETDDVLLLYGSRQVGKTSLMKIIQNNYIEGKSAFLDLENSEYLELLNKGIKSLLEYLKIYFGMVENKRFYLLIDEIQYLDNPTSLLKLLHDHFPNIKVIVSGSSTLEIRGKMKDSLVGRLLKFDVFPLDFKEFLFFKEKKKLANLVWRKDNLEIITQELKLYFEEYIIFGGYPKVVLADNLEFKKIYLQQIFDLYIQKDIKDIGKIRQIDKFNKLVKILAGQSGNLLKISELANTVNIAKQTVEEWMLLLKNTFVIDLISPFFSNLRSELSKMPKVYYIDTGLRNFILDQFVVNGANFENAMFSIFNSNNKKVNFWRTQDKKEIDFIIKEIPYELKLKFKGNKLTALDYFQDKYAKLGNVITLSKVKKSNYNQLYPWEV